jgi:hypothetical protein
LFRVGILEFIRGGPVEIEWCLFILSCSGKLDIMVMFVIMFTGDHYLLSFSGIVDVIAPMVHEAVFRIMG